jgi:uncharacterized protein (DUF849 family)
VAEELVDEPHSFSIVVGVNGGMPATPKALVDLVERLPDDAVWQAIGIGRANLAITAIGLAMGGTPGQEWRTRSFCVAGYQPSRTRS